MKTSRIFPVLLLFLIIGAVGCDNDNESNAQDMGEEPGAEQAMTTVTGKVVPPGDDDCSGMFPGFMDGDDVEFEMASTGGMSGTATVMVNQGTDGMIACSADGSGLEIIDSPPIANIICAVTSVTSQFTGVNVGDLITMVINFSGESPEQKEAAVTHIDSCIIIGIENLNADS